jgi:hypothetical protein
VLGEHDRIVELAARPSARAFSVVKKGPGVS